MSTIDIAAMGIILIFAVVGLFTGFVSQIFRIFALIIATFLAVKAPELIPQIFPSKIEGKAVLVHVFTIITIWIIAYTILATVSSFIVKRFHKAAPVLSVIDRVIGFFLGAVKGFLFGYIMLCIISLMSVKLTKEGFIPKKELEKSFSWKFVNENNIMKGRISGLS